MNKMHDKYTYANTYITLVLDSPLPVVVDNGEGNVVGNLADG